MLGQLADVAIRAVYGPEATAAVAPRALGHAAAAVQATVRTVRGRYGLEARSVVVAVHLPGAKTPLSSILDVDRAHASGLFQRAASPAPAQAPVHTAAKRKASAAAVTESDVSPGSDVAVIDSGVAASKAACAAPLVSDACCNAAAAPLTGPAAPPYDDAATSSVMSDLDLRWGDGEVRRSRRQRRAPTALTA